MERTENLESKAHVETVVLKVFVVSLVPLVLRVSRVRRELKDALDPVVNKVSKGQRATLATVGPKALVVVVQLVLRDLKESRVPRAVLDLQDLVLAVPLDLWAPVVSVARWVSKVPRVTLVHLVLREHLVAMGSRENVVHQDQWVALVFVDPRETRV
jgi:hypothetical protein